MNWPVQLHDPRFGFAWYAKPATFISHLTVAHADVATAEGLNDALDRVIAKQSVDIAAAGGLLVIQDFRTVRTYSSEARQAFVARMKRRPRGYTRGVQVVVGVNPLLRMAIQTGNIAFQMFIGGDVSIVTDPLVVLARHRVETPARGSIYP